MILTILILFSVLTVLFMTIIGFVVSFHFRKFGLPEDPFRRRLMRIFEVGSLFLVFLNVILLAINVFKK